MAQLASASGLGPEGPVFESQYPDILPKELTDFQWVLFLLLCIQQLNHLRFLHENTYLVDKRVNQLRFLHENANFVEKQVNQLRFLHENAHFVDKLVNQLKFLHKNAHFVDKQVNQLKFLHENALLVDKCEISLMCVSEAYTHASAQRATSGIFRAYHKIRQKISTKTSVK